jgi:hypothetical protein
MSETLKRAKRKLVEEYLAGDNAGNPAHLEMWISGLADVLPPPQRGELRRFAEAMEKQYELAIEQCVIEADSLVHEEVKARGLLQGEDAWERYLREHAEDFQAVYKPFFTPRWEKARKALKRSLFKNL